MDSNVDRRSWRQIGGDARLVHL